MRNLKPEERLIVAADFRPDKGQSHKIDWVKIQVLNLANKLSGLDIYLKMNSALRAVGYSLIDAVHQRGLRAFGDIKLFDIGETLETDGAILRELKPELITVAALAGVTAMKKLKAELPDTEVLGVTVLTSLYDSDTQAMFVCSVEEAVLRLAEWAKYGDADGLISSPKEAAILKAGYGMLMSINTPAIRPKWAMVAGDDQNPNRAMTVEEAIKAGADRIVVGRPITQAKDPYAATMRTIEEIARAMR